MDPLSEIKYEEKITGDSKNITVEWKGEKKVTANDFAKNAQVEVMNADMQIATLTDPSASLEMEVWIGPGRGYRSTEERGKEKGELGLIAVDALYSPILNVSYKVEATRVGEKTDFDKLVLRIETDGTVDPLDAANQTVDTLLDYVNVLKGLTYTEEAGN